MRARDRHHPNGCDHWHCQYIRGQRQRSFRSDEAIRRAGPAHERSL